MNGIRFVRHPVDRRTERYEALRGNAPVTFADALSLWQRDDDFTHQFCEALVGASFRAFCLEAPPVHLGNLDRAFEFVLVDAPDLRCAADRQTFRQYFDTADADHGVVAFDSLGGDARLIVPAPCTDDDDFAYLASFVNAADRAHVRALWRVVACELDARIGAKPIWLSTSGAGVAWLHVRLDRRPKYYRFRAYCDANA